MLVLFCVIYSSILFSFESTNPNLADKFDSVPNNSAVPLFEQELTASESTISPLDQNGIKDSTQLSFKPVLNSYFNFSIEQDTKLLANSGAFTTITGHDNILYLVSSDRVSNVEGDPYYNPLGLNVYIQNSTDYGVTWSEKAQTNLSQPEGDNWGWSSYYYWNLDIAYNASENSIILMMVRADSDEDNTLYFYKSFDQLNWEYMGLITDHISTAYYPTDLQADMILSTNGSEILVSIADSGHSYVYFYKSIDCAKTWTHYDIYVGSNPNSATIIMSPTNNKITIFWYRESPKQYFYAYSLDFGVSWSSNNALGPSQGFGYIAWGSGYADTPGNYYSFGRRIVMNYDLDGSLHGCVIVNGSYLYVINSTTDGSTWNTFEELRYYGVFHPLSLSYYRTDSKKDFYSFSGDMKNGKSVSLYFLYPKTIVSNSPVGVISGGSLTTISWDGKNSSNEFVIDGIYIARVWLTDELSGIRNNKSSFVRIVVDNTVESPIFTQVNSYFSPPYENSWETDYSAGIKDTTIVSFDSTEDSYYDVYYELQSQYSITHNVKITR